MRQVEMTLEPAPVMPPMGPSALGLQEKPRQGDLWEYGQRSQRHRAGPGGSQAERVPRSPRHGPQHQRRLRGQMNFHAGMAAEQRIAQDYERRGFAIARQRWRGKAGEIDLILRDGEGLIFVEVKQARNFDRAAESLSARQMRRIYHSAEEYLAQAPRGSLTPVRFDVALVDGRGATRILENAFGHG